MFEKHVPILSLEVCKVGLDIRHSVPGRPVHHTHDEPTLVVRSNHIPQYLQAALGRHHAALRTYYTVFRAQYAARSSEGTMRPPESREHYAGD